MADGLHPYDTGLSYADTSGGSYTAVALVVSVSCPEIKVGVAPSHHLKSTSAWKTKEPGMGDPGSMTFTIRYEKAQVNTLEGLYRQKKFWKVTLPDTSTWICEGFWTSFKGGDANSDDDATLMAELTIELSGAPSFTPAS